MLSLLRTGAASTKTSEAKVEESNATGVSGIRGWSRASR